VLFVDVVAQNELDQSINQSINRRFLAWLYRIAIGLVILKSTIYAGCTQGRF